MLRFDINFVFTIINVLILFAVVKIFLIGRVHKILDARKAIVDEQFSEAEKKLEEADKTKQQYEDSIKDIEEEKERRFTEARNQANSEYERLMEQAKKEAEEERQIRLRRANQEITDMVAKAAERIVTADQSEEMDKQLYDRFLEQVK